MYGVHGGHNIIHKIENIRTGKTVSHMVIDDHGNRMGGNLKIHHEILCGTRKTGA
jgi:hypothetical protein